MHMGFGGNPYGPAGTGKTESVKALGQAFGRQVSWHCPKQQLRVTTSLVLAYHICNANVRRDIKGS